MNDYFPTLYQLVVVRQTKSQVLAREFLFGNQINNGLICPGCHARDKRWRLNSSDQNEMAITHVCGQRSSITADTIFYKSSHSLVTWFAAIEAVYITGGNITTKVLAENIGVSMTGAWNMRLKICDYLRFGANRIALKEIADTSREVLAAVDSLRQLH